MTTKQTNTLNTTARTAIVSSFVTALTARDNTGSLVTQVCNVANKYLKGAEISAADQVSISDDIAKAKGWTADSLKIRVSEVKTVLRAYVSLPEAVEAFKRKVTKANWHDSMKLARYLNKGKSIAEAVEEATKKGSGSTATAKGRAAGALRAWAEAEPKKKALILKACELLTIELKFKDK